MGRYGNIDGIATLTDNPNATDNLKGTIGKRNGIWAMSKNVGPVCKEDKVVTLDDFVEYLEDISHSTKK
ncbi:MAG: hypothetical protein ACI358_01425 [Candidatus Limimorpha sp.]